MTISSSLNAGVSGLNANAARLATISDNIANSSTYGYKRAEADFHSMVINGQSSNIYSAGGVRVTTTRMIDESGPLVATSNPTDLAVSGRGMLPVTTDLAVANDNGTLPLLLVTTGSFRPDSDGVLRTDNGMVLLGWPANSDGSIPAYPRDTVAGLQPVKIDMNQFTGDPTTQIQLGVNLPASATIAGATGDPLELSVEYFGNLGLSDNLMVSFVPQVPAAGASNSWTMTVRDPADGNAVIGEYTLEFGSGPLDGGALVAVTQAAGAPGGAYDPATGTVTLDVGGNPLSLVIGAASGGRGLTQLSDSFSPVSITKDGTPIGNLLSIEVDSSGMMHAIYDTGFTRTIYQIPLADVPNVNGLISVNNQAYRVSPDSGPFFLWTAGEGPTGGIVGFAREESATDVAGELTQMIQTQRAYSSNAKVIQTVDEMLQETTNLKR